MPSRKTLQKALDKDKELQDFERQLKENSSWNEGINKRGKKREEKMMLKQEEQLCKAKVMKELLAMDEMNTAGVEQRPQSRRGKREISELETALKNRPITKKDRDTDEKQRQLEAYKIEESRKETEREEQKKRQAEEEHKLKKRGIVSDQKLYIKIDNESIFEENSIYDASNVEDAINIFEDDLPNANVLYNDFYNRNLPIVKSELPGLRFSQYQEKIKQMWKISFENPKNNH